MKQFKISLPLIAVVLGLALSSFTAERNHIPPKNADTHYFELTNPNQPLQGSAYTEVSQATYNSILCPNGTDETCKLVATTATLPTNLTDNDSNGIPDETGVIETVKTKNQ